MQRSSPIHDIQQTGNVSWQNSEDESDRQKDEVNIMFLAFNNIRSSIIVRNHYQTKRTKFGYKVDMIMAIMAL